MVLQLELDIARFSELIFDMISMPKFLTAALAHRVFLDPLMFH